MELNTAESIALGREVHRAFGSWQAALDAAQRNSSGVYVITRDALARAAAKTDSRHR